MTELTQDCPCCGAEVTMKPYDIGSGPEMSCPSCERCWGANGQDLKPLDHAAIMEQLNRDGIWPPRRRYTR